MSFVSSNILATLDDLFGENLGMYQKTTTCRLCEGRASYVFSKELLQKYEVAFFRCNQCESLQTEEPYWLDEAYADSRSIPDVGAVARVQNLQLPVWVIAKVFGLSSSDKILDWGGGDGLFVRMMRDMGLNAYLLDKYITNRYAVGFEGDLSQLYRMITAFEVWEHFSHPKVEIEKFFQCKPEILFVSTGLYKSQDVNWAYFTPLSGRHVFFYSEKARQYIAERFCYNLITKENYSIYYKNSLSWLNKWLLNILLSGRKQNIFRLMLKLAKKKNLVSDDRKLATEIIKNGGAGKINWP